MKYTSTLPLTALLSLGLISALVEWHVIPPGLVLLESMQAAFQDYFYALIVLIILLESIVYVGFYFPGQFFAVVLVVLAKPNWQSIVYLTLAMVFAATLGSLINYCLGRRIESDKNRQKAVSIKALAVAMIHINSLAFFMFNQGATHQPVRIVLLAGLLNLPYYLALIFLTSVFSQEVMGMAENPWLLAVFIVIWLGITLWIDIKNLRKLRNPA
jgi:membrane-associated protein